MKYTTMEVFRVQKDTAKNIVKRQKKIEKRLERRNWDSQSEPMLGASDIRYEVDGRYKAIPCGGIGAVHTMNKNIGLAQAIDDNLGILKRHLPYFDSDHILNMTYNVLVGGQCLNDIEKLRNDEGYLDALGAEIIPDPTTEGDYLRRFDTNDISALMDIINDVRKTVWEKQPPSFSERATINCDGTIVPTEGECKEGMDISYKGVWGYAPLLISLAETREPLFFVNRSGNAPSHLGSAEWIDKSLDLVSGTFEEVW
ncbi:MAG: IS1380 family transposase, partial [bacterium]|nr:IS1380 family transposase [bacterium]